MKETITTVVVEHEIRFVGKYCHDGCHKYGDGMPGSVVCGTFQSALSPTKRGSRFLRCNRCVEMTNRDRRRHGR